MKNIVAAFVVLLTMMLSGSCGKVAIPKDELTSTFNNVYISAAARNPNNVTLQMADTTYGIVYGASYGGYGVPAQDISVEFSLDDARAMAYNAANNTNYPLLPATAYAFTEPDAVIPAGSTGTQPLLLKVNPAKGMELFRDYIVAITLKVKDDTKVNPLLQTAYYIVRASLNFSDFADYDRSKWTIAGVSSEEPAEGATNGGLGIHAIDGKASTFWHTSWDGGYAPPPHWLAVDMGERKVIHGLVFTGRQSTNNGKPEVVQVDVSNNGTDWTSAGTLTLANTNSPQRFFVTSFPQGRYFRITVLTNFGNVPYTHLAELGAF